MAEQTVEQKSAVLKSYLHLDFEYLKREQAIAQIDNKTDVNNLKDHTHQVFLLQRKTWSISSINDFKKNSTKEYYCMTQELYRIARLDKKISPIEESGEVTNKLNIHPEMLKRLFKIGENIKIENLNDKTHQVVLCQNGNWSLANSQDYKETKEKTYYYMTIRSFSFALKENKIIYILGCPNEFDQIIESSNDEEELKRYFVSAYSPYAKMRFSIAHLQYEDGSTLLHKAAINKNTAIVRLILGNKMGATLLHKKNNKKESPLDIIKKGYKPEDEIFFDLAIVLGDKNAVVNYLRKIFNSMLELFSKLESDKKFNDVLLELLKSQKDLEVKKSNIIKACVKFFAGLSDLDAGKIAILAGKCVKYNVNEICGSGGVDLLKAAIEMQDDGCVIASIYPAIAQVITYDKYPNFYQDIKIDWDMSFFVNKLKSVLLNFLLGLLKKIYHESAHENVFSADYETVFSCFDRLIEMAGFSAKEKIHIKFILSVAMLRYKNYANFGSFCADKVMEASKAIAYLGDPALTYMEITAADQLKMMLSLAIKERDVKFIADVIQEYFGKEIGDGFLYDVLNNEADLKKNLEEDEIGLKAILIKFCRNQAAKVISNGSFLQVHPFFTKAASLMVDLGLVVNNKTQPNISFEKFSSGFHGVKLKTNIHQTTIDILRSSYCVIGKLAYPFFLLGDVSGDCRDIFAQYFRFMLPKELSLTSSQVEWVVNNFNQMNLTTDVYISLDVFLRNVFNLVKENKEKDKKKSKGKSKGEAQKEGLPLHIMKGSDLIYELFANEQNEMMMAVRQPLSIIFGMGDLDPKYAKPFCEYRACYVLKADSIAGFKSKLVKLDIWFSEEAKSDYIEALGSTIIDVFKPYLSSKKLVHESQVKTKMVVGLGSRDDGQSHLPLNQKRNKSAPDLTSLSENSNRLIGGGNKGIDNPVKNSIGGSHAASAALASAAEDDENKPRLTKSTQ